jgi:hypothetical protein
VGYNAFNAKVVPVEAIVLGLSSAVLSDSVDARAFTVLFPTSSAAREIVLLTYF